MKNSKIYLTIAVILLGIYLCIIVFVPHYTKFPYTLYCVISWVLSVIFMVKGSNASIRERKKHIQKLNDVCERWGAKFNSPGEPFSSTIKAFKDFGKACRSVEKITNLRGQDVTPPGERPNPPAIPPKKTFTLSCPEGKSSDLVRLEKKVRNKYWSHIHTIPDKPTIPPEYIHTHHQSDSTEGQARYFESDLSSESCTASFGEWYRFDGINWRSLDYYIDPKQYCNYKQSIKLRKYIPCDPITGVFWAIDPSDILDAILVKGHLLQDAKEKGWESTGVPAFNLYDLLPILPTEVKEKESYHEEHDLRYTAFWSCRHSSDGRFVSEYTYHDLDFTLCKYVSDNLAVCLAEILIVLFEEGYLKNENKNS